MSALIVYCVWMKEGGVFNAMSRSVSVSGNQMIILAVIAMRIYFAFKLKYGQ